MNPDETPPASVIIPVFNDTAGVARCLRAIATQTYPMDAIEVVVVDNGSVPPLTIDQALPFNLRVVSCATPGSYAARNAGAQVSSGEVLVFTDADCWADADWLANGIDALLAGGGKTILGGEVSIVKPQKPTSVSLYQWTTGFGQDINVRNKGFSATANLFCTRAQFDAVGPFEERLLSGGDLEWCRRAATHGMGVLHAPKAVVHTDARNSLRGAIRQARRVAAGRRSLRQLELAHIGGVEIARRRSPWQSMAWIWSRNDLGTWDRLRILFVATLIHAATALENLRLAAGGNAERR